MLDFMHAIAGCVLRHSKEFPFSVSKDKLFPLLRELSG